MKSLLTILLMTTCLGLKAEVNVNYVDVYQKSGHAPKVVRIPMSFNSDSLLREIPRISIGQIYQIDYVATAPKKSEMYYQKKLNAERWKKFKNMISIPAGSEHYENTFYQTRFETKEEAEKLFHGFVVYYDLPLGEVHLKSKALITALMEVIADTPIERHTAGVKIPKSIRRDSVYVGVFRKSERIE